MRLLLDEMLSPAIARELRAAGMMSRPSPGTPAALPCPTPTSWPWPAPSTAHWSPNNLRDFRPLHHEAITPGGAGHYGMIRIPGSYRRTRNDSGKIIIALEAILTEHPADADLANAETWL